MIIAETAEHFRFVTQPDHADLAGTFADHWGNDRFEAPNPPGPTMNAAYNHDTGWTAYDRQPHLDDDGRPIDFRDMPPETWIQIYEKGIDAVVAVDPYAGLLVSLHGSGLRGQRFGLSPSWPPTPAAYRPFIEDQEALQTRLCDTLRETAALSAADEALLSALHASGRPPDGESSQLWKNYKRLQAWDTLSLAFCTTESPPSYSEIRAVPTGGGSADETLSIDRVAPTEFRISPYPFSVSPLTVSLPTRTVQKADFDSETTLAQAYYRAVRERKSYTIHSNS